MPRILLSVRLSSFGKLVACEAQMSKLVHSLHIPKSDSKTSEASCARQIVVPIKRVLVTGPNGFIGQNLCRSLVSAGMSVVACVRGESDASVLGPTSKSLKICRISGLNHSADLLGALEDVDAVVHLAGRAHVMHETVADPLTEFRRVNVEGTEHLASLAAQSGVARFIFMSSIKVNGEESKVAPLRADDPPGYTDPYGQSKWEAEERLRAIAGASGMQWVVVRPPLVYGPGVRGNFLSLLQWVSKRMPLPVGSLDNSRSLVSIFNLCDFILHLLNHPFAVNNCFLVADEHDISTPDLVRRIAFALHRVPRIYPCPESILMAAGVMLNRKAAIQRLCSSLVVDRQKARDLLGWSARMTIEQGLERTAEWFLSSASV